MNYCICCLCISIIILIFIIFSILIEIGKNINEDDNYYNNINVIVTNNQLRGMYNESKNNYLQKISKEQYNIIYQNIIQLAEQNKNNYNFTIFCSEITNIPIEECIKQNNNGYRNMQYDITLEEIRHKIIKKLQKTFPDSIITKSYKNCCDYYRISWTTK